MKLLWALLVLCSGFTMFGRDSSFEVAVLRFRPSEKKLLLQDPARWVTSPAGTAAKFQEQLQKAGSTTLLFRTNQILSSTQTNAVKVFESYPLRAAGRTDPLGEVIALDLQLQIVPLVVQKSRGIAWSGSVRWSPEMLDYLSGQPATFFQPFTGTSDSNVATNGATIKRSLLDLCKTISYGPRSSPIIELPVTKTATFEGSALTGRGIPILQSTVAESGGQNAQALVLYLKLNP